MLIFVCKKKKEVSKFNSVVQASSPGSSMEKKNILLRIRDVAYFRIHVNVVVTFLFKITILTTINVMK